MSAEDSSRWASATPGMAAFAAVLLAMALGLSTGTYDPVALGLVTVAGCAALAGALVPPGPNSVRGRRATIAFLAGGLGASWVHDVLFLPGMTVDPTRLGAFRPLLGAMGVILITYAWQGVPRVARLLRYPAIVVLGIALGAIVILASPSPGIDVWTMQRDAAAALMEGRNPYSLAYPNIYGPGTPFLDPSLLTPDGRYVTAFPYMPLVLLLDIPGALIGDVRWTMLAALASSAFLLRRLGKGSLESELAGALLLLQPLGWMVLELAWTEPLALAGLLLLALAVTTSRSRSSWVAWALPGVAAALAVSTKQYVLVLALPFLPLFPPGVRLRAVILATCGAAALAIPFLAVDPSGFIRGVVEFQVRQPFRADALSWPAAVHAIGGPKLPPWPAFLLAASVMTLSLRHRMTTGRAMLAASATWIVFVAFNKQAFANYYWLAVGLLCASVALLSLPDEVAPSVDPVDRTAPTGAP